MKFVSYNIQYGFGADGRYDLERVADVIADADVIALQEVERNWQRTGHDDQPELLSRLLPHHYGSMARPSTWMPAASGRTARSINRRRQFGTMLLVALSDPVVAAASPADAQGGAAAQHAERRARRPDPHAGRPGPHLLAPSVAYRRRGAARADRFPQGAASPRSVRRRTVERRRRRAGPRLGAWREPSPKRRWRRSGWAISTASRAATSIVAITGRNPYHPSAAYLDGFVDAAVAAGGERAASHTHVRMHQGKEQKRRLDYCFVGSMLADRVRSVSVDTGCIASDHFPVTVDIDLETPGSEWLTAMTLGVFLAVLAAAAMHADLECDDQGAARPLRVDLADDGRHGRRRAAGAALRRASRRARLAADRRIGGAAYRLPAVPGQSLCVRRPRPDLSAGARRGAAADDARRHRADPRDTRRSSRSWASCCSARARC